MTGPHKGSTHTNAPRSRRDHQRHLPRRFSRRYRDISSEALTDTLNSLEEDFADGRYKQADLLWRATLERATVLSREYTPDLGTRSLDVLHVASALELELRHFVTFDLRQQKLARAVGLKLIMPKT